MPRTILRITGKDASDFLQGLVTNDVGKLDRDQVKDYAARKGWTLEEAERWLAPNLGY